MFNDKMNTEHASATPGESATNQQQNDSNQQQQQTRHSPQQQIATHSRQQQQQLNEVSFFLIMIFLFYLDRFFIWNVIYSCISIALLFVCCFFKIHKTALHICTY